MPRLEREPLSPAWLLGDMLHMFACCLVGNPTTELLKLSFAFSPSNVNQGWVASPSTSFGAGWGGVGWAGVGWWLGWGGVGWGGVGWGGVGWGGK